MPQYASAALAASLTSADLVAVLLAGIAVGEPVHAGSLAIVPLGARDPLREPATRVVTVGEAMERAWLTLRVARDDTGARVLLQSWADAVILISAGEELPGCRGLVAVRDVLVPPGARGLGVPVSTAPAIAAPGDEQRAWQHRIRALEAVAPAFPSDCEGVLVAVGDRSVGVELYPSSWLLSQARGRLLRGAAFEALSTPDHAPMGREDAEGALRDLADLPWARREPVGLGFETAGSAPGMKGTALFLGGALVHFSAISRGSGLLLAAPEPTRP